MPLLTAASGRRTKFVIVLVWLAILAAVGPLAGKFEDAQNNEASSFLPKGAESVRALDLSKRFPSGQTMTAVTVLAAADRLTGADRARIAGLRRSLNRDRPPVTLPTEPPRYSPDGTTAVLATPIRIPNGTDDRPTDAVEQIRDRAAKAGGPMQVAVTGDAGFLYDQVEVFSGMNGTILMVTAALILVLLIVIYRSPVFWLIPFFSVVLAEICSRGMGYLLSEAGVVINGQTGGILPVLVFGAGTDYALLLVARYREELRRFGDKHDAMRMALRRAGPAIVASAGTVCAGLLTFSLADVQGTASLGPVGAAGVALAALVTMTMLPALLLIFGRRAFWPFIPLEGSEGSDASHGLWRRIGERIAASPRRVWVGSLLILGVFALGLIQVNDDLTSSGGFRDEVESVRGQKMLSRAFPPGTTAPSLVVVTDPSRTAAVRRSVAAVDGVAAVERPERGAPGAQFKVVLDANPYGEDGFALIPPIRAAAHRAAPGQALVGGPTAQEADLRSSASRDNVVIIPVALFVVLLILAALLRALLAPLMLVGTVIASYAAALGLGTFFFENVFGFQGLDPTLPVLAFVFLVALGIDYNIFLMARAREETVASGTREGIVRALAVTGAVITSAGIVLAGTFSVLTVFPLVTLVEIGFVIAVGVLLDTFLVRSILVPALVVELGGRTWWPSGLDRRGAPPEPGSGPVTRSGA